jgi:hypothetical protein
MVAAKYYSIIYLIIVSFFTIVSIHTKIRFDVKNNILPVLFLCVFMVVFIGLRPVNIAFVDMVSYAQKYDNLTWNGFDFKAENLLFDNLMAFMAGSEYDVSLFFLLMATLYFGAMLVACIKIFPNHTTIAFLVCLAAFSTFSFGTNGIKAGVAASLFLVALAYRDNIAVSILFIVMSWGFHHSMVLPVAAYVATCIFKNNKWYFYVWLICLIISLLHITFFQTLFAGMTDERGAGYLSSVDPIFVKHGGFRYDFVIYSAMPILMGYYAKFKYKLESKRYDMLLNMYLFCNAIWLLCMYAPFTNRIAYLSWFMYPIVLVYPCLAIKNRNHPLVRYRNTIIGLHLTFTLFMTFIYYS